MREGIHRVRSSFGYLYNIGTVGAGGFQQRPHRIPLNNGDFEKNFKISGFEILATGNDAAAGNRNGRESDTVFIQIATSEDAAKPRIGNDEYSDTGGLRMEDERCIGWATVNGSNVFFHLADEHILIDDVYITAWSLTTGGTVTNCASSVGYYLEFECIDNSGAQGIVYAYRGIANEDD